MTRQLGLLIVCSFLFAIAAASIIQQQDDGSSKQPAGSLRLIALAEDTRVWLNEAEISQLEMEKVHFMDVTDHPTVDKPAPRSLTMPAVLRLGASSADIPALISELSSANIEQTITELAAFFTRYYTTQTAVQAAKLLHDKYTLYANGAAYIEVEFFEHSWAQPSVIARILGTGSNANELVVLGGHEDSTAGGPASRSPGADDDASGSATVLEVFRVLAKNGYRGERTIEFHAYAAEEGGLRGSQDIASRYSQDDKVVVGMMQLDMVGYVSNNRAVYGLVTDFVDPATTQYVKTLANEYSNLPVVETRCGYGCSDHASWTRFGYPSSFPFETAFNSLNPYIHTAADTLDKIDVEHALEFGKVALAFVVEMASQ